MTVAATRIVPGTNRWLGDKDATQVDRSTAQVAEPGHDDATEQVGGSAEEEPAAVGIEAPHASEDRGERAPTIQEDRMPKGTPTSLTHNGETRTIAEWAQIAKVTPTAFRNRLYRGWSLAQAITGAPPASEKRGPKAHAAPAPKAKRTDAIPPPSRGGAKKFKPDVAIEAARNGVIVGPLELLLAAGFDADAVEVPAGLMIVVKTS